MLLMNLVQIFQTQRRNSIQTGKALRMHRKSVTHVDCTFLRLLHVTGGTVAERTVHSAMYVFCNAWKEPNIEGANQGTVNNDKCR